MFLEQSKGFDLRKKKSTEMMDKEMGNVGILDDWGKLEDIEEFSGIVKHLGF